MVHPAFRSNREKIMLEREIGRNAKNMKKSGDLPPEREIRHLWPSDVSTKVLFRKTRADADKPSDGRADR